MTYLATLISAPVTNVLGWTFIHFLWQGTLVGGLLWTGLFLTRRWHANARYTSACTALILLLVSPLITSGLLYKGQTGNFTPQITAVQIQGQAREQSVSVALPTQDTPRALPSTQDVKIGQEAQVRFLARPPIQFLFPWIVLFWAAGTFLLSMRLLGGWLVLHRFRTRGVKLAPEDLQGFLLRLSEQIGVSQPVRLMVSSLTHVPMVIGWLRPVILIPASAVAGLTTQQLEMILAHELAHIKRHDYLVNLLQTLVETLLFFHPVVWWISHVVRAEREYVCDDMAVAVSGGQKAAYARALAELQWVTESKLAVAASGGSLLYRVQRLLGKQSHQPPSPTPWPAGVMTVMLITGLLAWSQAQPPEPAAPRSVEINYPFLNLNFEQRIANYPSNWFINPGGAATAEDITIVLDADHAYDGEQSLRLTCGGDACRRENTPPRTLAGHIVGMQRLTMTEVQGKVVRLSGAIKTEDLQGYASLWWRADGVGVVEFADVVYVDMQEQQVGGTTDWHRYEIMVPIPDDAVSNTFGVLVSGHGTAWFDDLRIEVLDLDARDYMIE